MAKTRTQIAQDLGISKTTLWRMLKTAPFTVKRGLIFPGQEEKIRNFILYGKDHNPNDEMTRKPLNKNAPK